MRTLIFNGSPRLQGDTAALLARLCAGLPGEIVQVDAYRAKVSPCVDCRRCWQQLGCVIDDEMQQIYRDIADTDAIVIASPVYFSQLTGPLLSLMSRLQMYFTAAHFLGQSLLPQGRRGGIILCGGGNGSAAPAEQTARTLLRCMHAQHVGTVRSCLTDTLPAKSDQAALREIDRLAEMLSRDA